MDEEQIELKNEFTNEHEELQIKHEPNDQGFILSPIENPNFGNCDNVIQREELNSKQFVKSENIQNCSNNEPSGSKELNFPNNKMQDKSEATSQKLIKTFLQTDQGMVLIGKIDSLDSSTSSTIDKKSTKPLIQLKTEPETVAETGIFVKSEPNIKPEMFIGITETDLSQEMSNLSDDPLRISVHEEKKQHDSSVHEEKNPEILPNPPNRLLFSCFLCSKIFESQALCKMHISANHGGRKLDYKEHVEGFHKAKLVNYDENKKKFQCSICLKYFKTKSYLINHLSRVHEEKGISLIDEKNKPFQCPFCPSKFSYRVNMIKHRSKVHEGKGLDHGIKESSKQVHEKKKNYSVP